MKSKNNFLYLVGFATILYSCVSSRNQKYSTSTYIDIEDPQIQAIPVIADLNISKEKVKGTATMGYIKGMAMPIEECKKSAIGNALIASESDVLIEPFYIIETTDASVTVQVAGFPAKYRNFRKDTVRLQELKALANLQATNANTSIAPKEKKNDIHLTQTNNKSGKVALWTLLGLSAYIGLLLMIL